MRKEFLISIVKLYLHNKKLIRAEEKEKTEVDCTKQKSPVKRNTYRK
jgi:hypothetical protein